MVVDKGTPMGDYFAEIWTKLLKVNIPILFKVHKSKTESILFILSPIDE